MRETELTIDAGGGVTLAATLTLPDGPAAAAVLFLHGSGPLDRNENMPGQSLDVFNTIATELASAGIASLRYDKRGCGKSSGVYHNAGQTELLSDAASALTALLRSGDFPRLFLVGHSEGTLLGARLSLIAELDGLVLLAPFVQRLETLLIAQAAEVEKAIRAAPGFVGWLTRMVLRVLGSPSVNQRRLIARLKSGTEDSFRHFGRQIEARSLRELLAIDPAEIYRQVRVPMLVLGGGKDVQCNPADVAAIAAIGGPLAEPVLIDDLTHLLRRDDGPAGFAAYGRLLKLPLDKDVVRIVREWLTRRTAAER
jgi:uncharacterized protein